MDMSVLTASSWNALLIQICQIRVKQIVANHESNHYVNKYLKQFTIIIIQVIWFDPQMDMI